MHYTKTMGLAAPELKWVPAPTYILRRAAILDRLRDCTPGRVLEVGCGPGALLHDLAKLGHKTVGVEPSEASQNLAKAMLENTENVEIHSDFPLDRHEYFDYLLSFEVLEHIEDDATALQDWLRYLKPGGTLMVSVPAHKNRWNVTDVMAGHFRRYDREDVMCLFRKVGIEPDALTTYGWPISAAIERLRNWVKERQIRRRGVPVDAVQPGDIELSKASGADRTLEASLYPYYGSAPGCFFFFLATRAQRAFYSTSLGISYLVVARKPPKKNAHGMAFADMPKDSFHSRYAP